MVLATGARERPRAARLVPGTRPLGDLHHRPAAAVGAPPAPAARRAGAHRGRRARLVLRGADPARGGRPPRGPGHRTSRARRRSASSTSSTRVGLRVPVWTGTSVDRCHRARRGSTGCSSRGPDGAERAVAVDAVVFTGDFIPDNELARLAAPRDRSRHERSGLRGRRPHDAPGASSRPATSSTRPRRRTWRHNAPAPSAGPRRRGCATMATADLACRHRSGRVRVADPLLWVVPNLLDRARPGPSPSCVRIPGLPGSPPSRGDPGWPAPRLVPPPPHDPEPVAPPAVRLAAARASPVRTCLALGLLRPGREKRHPGGAAHSQITGVSRSNQTRGSGHLRQDLGLLVVELGLGQDPLVLEAGQLLQLVDESSEPGAAAARAPPSGAACGRRGLPAGRPSAAGGGSHRRPPRWPCRRSLLSSHRPQDRTTSHHGHGRAPSLFSFSVLALQCVRPGPRTPPR